MNTGWVKLWRKSIDSICFANPNLWKVWTWCLMRANHKKNIVPLKTGKGLSETTVQPGQFIYGRHSASDDLNMPPSSVRNYIQKLINIDKLDRQSFSHYSIIIVLNWEKYQSDKEKEDRQTDKTGQAKDRQNIDDKNISNTPNKDNNRTGKGQAKDTNKNDKNDKKSKKKSKRKRFQKPSVKEIERYCKKRNNKIDPEAFYHFYESKNWMVGKNKMKSWKSAIITWEKKRKDDIKNQQGGGGF